MSVHNRESEGDWTYTEEKAMGVMWPQAKNVRSHQKMEEPLREPPWSCYHPDFRLVVPISDLRPLKL